MIPDCDVSWFHFPISDDVCGFKFKKGQPKQTEIVSVPKKDFNSFLRCQNWADAQLLIVDGLTDKEQDLSSIMNYLGNFVRRSVRSRCIVASSLAASKVFTRAKFYHVPVCAPDLDDYNTAITKSDFLASVWNTLADDYHCPAGDGGMQRIHEYYKEIFDEEKFPLSEMSKDGRLIMSESNARRLVAKKWRFAGHSWRYMFYTTVDNIKADIMDAIDAIGPMEELYQYLIHGRGPKNDDTKNRLVFKCSAGQTLVSPYAAEMLVLCSERSPAVLQRLQPFLAHLFGRGTEGKCFELKFFQRFRVKNSYSETGTESLC
ncbi:uncharacterized protein LOC129602723 isoform X1 [Paramacrobiotus metropolitanus]|nr:uncharacterized protein LOC129602723 isoform X1 [Paramacrobiotus metropolitanus]XP_055357816.1 uncharacterized protein LOC129602723 isoform X1 [Paramacrobiotus metropolitanus]